jgi:hypothetical protein
MAATNFGACEMSNIGIHEETPLDRAIVRQDEALQKQANECGNRLYAMCMELIEERCALKLEVARLNHKLAELQKHLENVVEAALYEDEDEC